MNSDMAKKDEILLEATEERGDDDLPASERTPIVTQPMDPPVTTVFEMERDGRLNLQPDFQRKSVWDDGKSSRLIESILLNVPLPIVYLAENDDGGHSVIDGQQRLTAIVRFMKNEYALRGLKVFLELTNKKFKDLGKPQQRAIMNGVVHCVVIKKESNPGIRFEIFERLNTGAVPLNAQELRNCVFRGPFNDLLKRLETYPDWLKLIRLTEPDKRMKDRELILRFFALHDRYNNYGSSMTPFLNAEMREKRNIEQSRIVEYDALFKKVVRMSLSVFGDHAFERFSVGNAREHNGHWEGKINLALYDIAMCGFAQYEERDVIPNGEAISEALMNLMTTHQEFIDAISNDTSRKETLRTRMTIWEMELRKICRGADAMPRIFPYALKKRLFDQDNVCHLCGNRIVTIDDAAVDHDQPWSKGGETTEGNAKLAHRYCNISGGNRA